MPDDTIENQQHSAFIPWWFIGGVGVIIYVMGVMGYRQALDAPWIDCFYMAWRLFILEFEDIQSPMPMALQLSRWLSPALLSVGIIQAVLSVFRDQADKMRAKLLRDHTIVCGAGQKGRTLAIDLKANGHRVAIIERQTMPAVLRDLRGRGILGIQGDGSTGLVLRQACLHKAKSLVIVTGNDRDNAAIALNARAMLDATERVEKVRVLAHIADPGLRDLLRDGDDLGGAITPITTFNVYRNIARLIYRDHPLERLKDGVTAGSQVHLVLPGLDEFGIALIHYTAQIGHYPGALHTRIHIVSPSATEDINRLHTRYPGLKLCCTLHAHDHAPGVNYADAANRVVEDCAPDAAVNIIINGLDELHAYSAAMAIHNKHATHPGVRIFIPDVPASPFTGFIKQRSLEPGINLLPGLADACGCESVMMDALDRTAMAMHQEWYVEEEQNMRRKQAAGESVISKPTFKPWRDYSEEQKDANRLQADHIPVKIRAAGIDPRSASDPAVWQSLSKELLERLAIMEHARWCADKWMAGWSYAAKRNDTRKQHNNLVPYDQLDEPTKQYDRDTVLKLHRYLKG